MPSLFGGGGGKTSQRTVAGRSPGNRGRTLFDLLQNAATGQLLHPPVTPISTPTRQGIGAIQSILPALFAQGFGPNRGVASLLGGGGTGSAGTEFPTFGATPTREELGIGMPEIAPPEFLPDSADVAANLPRVRRPLERGREEKLRRKISRAKEGGRDYRARKLTGKLERLEGKAKYLPGQ